MSSSLTPSRFVLDVPGVGHDLEVLSFQGTEALNTGYRFVIDCVSERADLDLEGLLHQQAFLQFDDAGQGVHGLIQQITQGESGPRLTRYQLELVPRLDYLRFHHDQRIFTSKSIPQILTAVEDSTRLPVRLLQGA